MAYHDYYYDDGSSGNTVEVKKAWPDSDDDEPSVSDSEKPLLSAYNFDDSSSSDDSYPLMFNYTEGFGHVDGFGNVDGFGHVDGLGFSDDFRFPDAFFPKRNFVDEEDEPEPIPLRERIYKLVVTLLCWSVWGVFIWYGTNYFMMSMAYAVVYILVAALSWFSVNVLRNPPPGSTHLGVGHEVGGVPATTSTHTTSTVHAAHTAHTTRGFRTVTTPAAVNIPTAASTATVAGTTTAAGTTTTTLGASTAAVATPGITPTPSFIPMARG